MRLLNLSDEHLPADWFLPSVSFTLAPGASETVTLAGKDAEAFGVTRIIFSTRNYFNGFGENHALTVSARIKDTREVWFEEVHGQAITSLFRNYAMQIPAVIEAGQELELTITEHSGSGLDTDIEIVLQGLTRRQLDVRRQTIRDQLGFVPEKRWLYTPATSIAAGATEIVEFRKEPHEQVFSKLGVGAENSFQWQKLKLIDRTATRIETVGYNTLQFLYDQIEGDPYLFTTGKNEALTAELTNSDPADSSRTGLLADTLPGRVLDALDIAR